MNDQPEDRGATFRSPVQPNDSNDSSEPAKVAWVTGSGANRVGRAIAQEFANCGYHIVLHANRSIDKAEEFASELRNQRVNGPSPQVLVVQGDICDPTVSKRILGQILEAFGRLDVLVNSAAVWDWKPLTELTAEDVKKQFDVNTLGTLLCSQAAGLAMTEQPEGGSILLIGDWAVTRPYRDFAAYFASKGSIETLTKTLAVELATRNPSIRVNAVLPGPVMLDDRISQERADAIREQSLLKRHGTPEDVARAVRFLSEQPFITGAILPVDGGRSFYAGHGLDAVAHPTFGKP